MDCPYCHNKMKKGRFRRRGLMCSGCGRAQAKAPYKIADAVLMGRCGIWRSPSGNPIIVGLRENHYRPQYNHAQGNKQKCQNQNDNAAGGDGWRRDDACNVADDQEQAHSAFRRSQDGILRPRPLHRNETKDQVTVDAANATKRLGVAVKCATITPNKQRMIEFPQLTEMWKSPTPRSAPSGRTVFRAPIVIDCIKPVVHNWEKPITVARHPTATSTKLLRWSPTSGRVHADL